MTLVDFFGNGPDPNTAAFETFWRIVPRRTGKGAARAAFIKALNATGVDAATIIAGAERWAKSPESVPGKADSIPMPSTWLNQERWDDDPTPTLAESMAHHPAQGARIPPPTVGCAQCEAGFIFHDDDTVSRCTHCG